MSDSKKLGMCNYCQELGPVFEQEDKNGTSSENDSSENAAENQQESVQTADKTHSVWYLFGAAVSAMLAGFAGSKRKKKSDEEL